MVLSITDIGASASAFVRILLERRDRGRDRRVAFLRTRTHVTHVCAIEQQRRRPLP